MSRFHAIAALAVASVLGVTGCGIQGDDAAAREQGSSTTKPSSAEPTKASFAAAADAVCIEAASHFGALEDPDGVGGAKPLGVGAFMRKWTVGLRALDAPEEVRRDWIAGLDLLDRAADKLTESEEAAAAGDLKRSGETQGEALWNLEAQAQEHFHAMRVPFRVCFVE